MTWVINGTEHLDDVSNYRTIVGVCIALATLTTIVVSLRAYCRAVILKVLGADDYVIFFTAVSTDESLSINITDFVCLGMCYHIQRSLYRTVKMGSRTPNQIASQTGSQ